MKNSNYYHIISFEEFRKTEGVMFYNIPVIEETKAIDLVIHKHAAQSPGSINSVDRPWYYHYAQTDNLVVTSGKRTVDLYFMANEDIETFEVTPYYIDKIFKKNGEIISRERLIEEPAILGWKERVFHRVKSDEDGSVSLNFAQRSSLFNIDNNFNIYNLKIERQTFQVLRRGFEDQKK